MEEIKSPVEILLERGQAFAKTSIQLIKLKATGKVAEIISNFAAGFVMLILVALLFINLNIGIALLLGDMLGKIWMGFLILSGFYGFAGIVVYLFRDRWIKTPISNTVISQLLKEEEVPGDKGSEL
jgi:hypothetical protein